MMGSVVLWLALWHLGCNALYNNDHRDCNQNDTVLQEEFCQVYYKGTGDCTQLRASVCADHSGALPVLTLGDPKDPPMVFLHGWPDSSALWANQFEAFCAPPHGHYFCVAPSWFDFHPDLPARPETDLVWDKQVDAIYTLLAVDMGLKNITFVIFDFGSVLGYQFVYRFPDLLASVISMDIGMSTQSPVIPTLNQLLPYQQTNIRAFRTHNQTMERANSAEAPLAIALCTTMGPGGRRVDRCPITSNWGWPYAQIINTSWPDGVAPGVPRAQWKFSTAPDFPSTLPLLFLYGKCDIGTGSGWGKPCVNRSYYFFSQEWVQWVDGRGSHSKVVALDGAGHWTQCKVPSATNAVISEWLQELF